MASLNPLLQEVIETVKLVARVEIMPRYLKVAHERKTDGSLFTQADLAAQNMLERELRRIADYPVLGEEMAESVQFDIWNKSKDGLWCVDPIDGTSNFVNGIPYFGISVAFMRRERPVLGVVYDPVADEVFYAEEGNGAYLNGISLPIKENIPHVLEDAVAEVDLKRLSDRLGEALGKNAPYMSQRNFGASTLDWCYVAAGRFDLYLHGGQKLWDYAAGSLILQEAGGKMCTQRSEDFWGDDLWTRSAIAALNPELFKLWKDWIYANQ